MEDREYGARIEQGEITQETEEGYVIASYSREGVVSPAINAIDEKTYAVGDRVFFFLLDDGTGKILTAF